MGIPEKTQRVSNTPQTVEKALDIVEAFVHAEGSLGITELSNKLKMNKSTVYRILQVLLGRDYVHQDNKTNKYYLGYKILTIGGALLGQIQLREVAKTHLEELVAETAQTVRLAILDQEEVVYIDHVEGRDPISIRLQIGSRGPVYCTAAGKSILAFLEEKEKNNILARCTFEALTSKTIIKVKNLKAHLRQIKNNGYSFCDEEYAKGVRAVGAPVFDREMKVIGSIVVVAPSFRMKHNEVRTFGKKVKETGLAISRKMGCPVTK